MSQNLESIDSKFRYILIAAKRARQLQAGAKPMIHTASRKPTKIAQEEMKADMVQWELTPYAASKFMTPTNTKVDGATKESKK